MGRDFEPCIWILSRRYEAIAEDLDKLDARRTAQTWIMSGFLARIRVYRPLNSSEKRYLVYVARPRGMAQSHPMAIPATAEAQ
jgi:hypothetical protein